MMTYSYLKLNNLIYLLVKDSCIIFILFPCYIQQLLAVSESSVARRASNARRPLIDRIVAQVTQTYIYIYIYIYIH